MNIFLVEDNTAIIKGLDYSFTKNNFQFSYKTSIKEAQSYLKNNKDVDLIILDITLPDGNGVKFYKEFIKDLNIPTIFLTANDEEERIVDCLEAGAEDYITKPFMMGELLARVRKILRKGESNTVKVKDITFDFDKMEVRKANELINLSSLELKILHLLFLNLNKVVTRQSIIEHIWEWTGNDVYDNTITVYMKRIREKLNTDIIITIKGIGYRIDEK